MDGLNLRQSFDDERADGTLLCLVHLAVGQMVRVSIEREGRAKCIIFALESAPQKSVTFEVEGWLEALCLRLSGACSFEQYEYWFSIGIVGS
jgi:hypothetical protein